MAPYKYAYYIQGGPQKSKPLSMKLDLLVKLK